MRSGVTYPRIAVLMRATRCPQRVGNWHLIICHREETKNQEPQLRGVELELLEVGP
jgi:hypothetical protein